MTPAAIVPIVHVVDDDAPVRAALTRMLRIAGFNSRGYASAAEFLVGDDHAGGCLVLDVSLPGMSGVELQAVLAKVDGSLPIVFLTGRGDIATSVRAMKAGAVDFLTKPVKRDVLLAAVRTAIARDAAARAQRAELRGLRNRFETLTTREREVFERVINGKLNKQIADDLGTSIRTVKAHRANVMSKMAVGSLAELVGVGNRLDRAARS
ncbi:MAG TPA: response regulator [Casimicrobiaceae bacterium]|nr:response regulator [Casimicrobiaceae bacterium]